LRCCAILDPEKTVIPLSISNASSIPLASQPLATVDAYIDAKGKPALHPNVHQANFGVLIVVVQMRALGRLHDQAQGFGLAIAPDPKRKTAFHSAQQCDGSFLDCFFGHQLRNEPFLTDLRTWQLNLGPSQLLETLVG